MPTSVWFKLDAWRKVQYMKQHGWYRNWAGNLAHRKCYTKYSIYEIKKMPWTKIFKIANV